MWQSVLGTARVKSGWCLLEIMQVLLAPQLLSPLLSGRFHGRIGAPLCTQFSNLDTRHLTRICSSPQMLKSCSDMAMPELTGVQLLACSVLEPSDLAGTLKPCSLRRSLGYPAQQSVHSARMTQKVQIHLMRGTQCSGWLLARSGWCEVHSSQVPLQLMQVLSDLCRECSQCRGLFVHYCVAVQTFRTQNRSCRNRCSGWLFSKPGWCPIVGLAGALQRAAPCASSCSSRII